MNPDTINTILISIGTLVACATTLCGVAAGLARLTKNTADDAIVAKITAGVQFVAKLVSWLSPLKPK